MKKEYVSPEFDLFKVTLEDVILASILEETIPEIIGGDEEEGGDPLDGF
ncbi:MAG: hypothetical protein IIU39_06595 [Ruminococcus sp.]|nr:hypothetical protein [Ruminococcus sp.]